MNMKLNPLAGAVLCALPLVTRASDELAPIDVTATVPTPANTDVFAFEAEPGREPAEILSAQPGISGKRKGGHGTDLVIRGLSENRLNVLLDGAYVFGGCPSRMDPPTSYASFGGYDQVTVIKGMQTLEHGPGGPGGTVLLSRTTDPFGPDESFRGRIEGGYHSNSDTREFALDAATGSEKGYIRALASHTDAGSYKDGAGRQVRSSYSQDTGTLILGYTPDADQRWEFSIDKQNTSDMLFPGLGMDSPYANDTALRLKYRTTGGIGPVRNLRMEIYRTRVEHLMDNYSLRNSPAPDLASPSDSVTTGGKLVGELDSSLGRWKLGVDAQINRRDARRQTRTGVLQSILWPDAKIRQLGIFAELTHGLDPTNRLLAGLRYDRVDASADQAKVNTNPAAAPTAADIPANLYTATYGTTARDRSENNLSGLLRWEHDLPGDSGMTYLSLSRSVRTADASERYLAMWMMNPTMVRVGNPAIAPEKHHQLEAGAAWRQADWRVDASAYVNKVQDYILRDRNAARNEIYRNIDATLYGVETTLQWQPAPHWQTSLGVSWVHAQNDTDHRPIAQTPPLEANLSLDYRSGPWQTGAKVRAAATQTRVDTLSSSGVPGDGLDARKTPGWMVLDLYGRYRINDSIDLSLGVDNLLDHSYAEHLNLEDGNGATVQVNEPGRSLWLKLSATY